ncbi:unnamed protein product [Lota lota]
MDLNAGQFVRGSWEDQGSAECQTERAKGYQRDERRTAMVEGWRQTRHQLRSNHGNHGNSWLGGQLLGGPGSATYAHTPLCDEESNGCCDLCADPFLNERGWTWACETPKGWGRETPPPQSPAEPWSLPTH